MDTDERRSEKAGGALEPGPGERVDYLTIALAKVQKDGTLIQAIRGMSSNDIRRLCGIPANGERNPPGFSPRKIRNALVGRLPQIRRDEIQEQRRAKLEQAIHLEPSESNTTVTLDEMGRFVLTEPEVF